MLQNWDVSRIEASQHLSQGRKRPFTGSLVMGCPCGSNTPQREATVLRRIVAFDQPPTRQHVDSLANSRWGDSSGSL